MNDNFFIKAKKMLSYDEGESVRAYDDATGDIVRAPKGNLTIGIGFNLDATTEEVVDLLFTYSLGVALNEAKRIFPHFESYSEYRQFAIINMLYNLGATRFRKFTKMISAIQRFEWKEAAYQATHSFWFEQVKARGDRVVEMLEHDAWPDEYT